MNVQLPEHLFVSDDFEIWPENLDALNMFLRCQTQWRSAPGGLIGLDYAVVLELFRLYDVSNHQTLLEDLQVMEGHALQLFAEAIEKEQKAANRKSKR